ncbi:hypothetical protein D9M69_587680 [compost metagenome]
MPIDPVMTPARLMPRSCCLRLKAMLPNTIAGIPVRNPKPRSDKIPRISEAMEKPFDELCAVCVGVRAGSCGT